MRRTGAIAAAFAAMLVLAAAGEANAASRVICNGMTSATSTVGSTNFLVHYDPAAITGPQATQLDADAEAGRTLELTTPFAFPTPPSDTGVTPAGNNPDGRTDVWIYTDQACSATTTPCGCNGFMQPDGPTGTPTGWIYVNPTVVGNKSTIAHEFFHLVQRGISTVALSPLGGTNREMMREASASWIGALAAGNDGGHQPTYQRTGGLGQTLDFVDNSGEILYGEWPFFEYESERFGFQVVRDDFAQANSAPAGGQTQWMDAALQARGSSLGSIVADYAATVNAADWPIPLLAGTFPRLSSDTVLGVNTNTSTNQANTLNHLTTRFFRLTSNACSGQCEATLHLDVGWPSGSGVQASLMRFGSPTGTRIPLTGGDTGAHADIPFNLNTSYAVAVTNPSLTADAVPISLSANATTPPPAPSGTTTAPRQVTPPQTVIPIPVPTLSLSGKPKVARSGRSRVLKLTVQSSAAGFVVATLTSGKAKLVAHAAAKATTASTTAALAPGTNKLKIKLSRRLKKGRYTLTLTPQSSNFVAGTPVSAGRVSVPKPPKAKKRKKRASYIV